MTPHDQFTGNTTIGAVITNGAFSKAELNKNCLYDPLCLCQMHQSCSNYG